ncbi:hypothetical protein Kpol_1024p25 [Vanderwaltozyma polyspora DSM 70294]|uniref:Kinase n=1 Tax=Vanderwaltozyma polyspora (strain ATCC 22028 / DSM 70294 / BCRC 21397 / CBS 2163 / NBRC 10782 / NRRL Y-8283 / UCD 57-17) TaxID=436907 RepID=A7TLI5_VANPO|nr:uncharacterized protein Kpol_1024p25 [Vanderwaltozyma polyspora DSM 70294]EDO16871.1 hypothetical protein Kpol_1024p25 [Vanderwaltozyma polyspora DSM 70294]
MVEEYQLLKHKAAGHDGTLTDADGLLVFKLTNDKEIEFYRSIQEDHFKKNYIDDEDDEDKDEDDNNEIEMTLASWMPSFVGILEEGINKKNVDGIVNAKDFAKFKLNNLDLENNNANDDNNSNSNGKKYIVLENLLKGFNKPNIMDIKLGKILYDDDATEEKRKRLQEVSDNTTSGSLGFRICGMKVQSNSRIKSSLDPNHFEVEDDGDYIFVNKLFGRTRSNSNISIAIDDFLNNDQLSTERISLIKENFWIRLQILYNLLLDQEIRMISSSLLFIYEGDPNRWDELKDEDQIIRNYFIDYDDEDDDDYDDDDNDNEKLAAPLSSMSLIDFAHSRFVPGESYDENVVSGVENLLSIFENLKSEHKK